MEKEKLLNGTVFEFKLINNLGYAYCKIADFRYIRAFDGLLVKVFDHIVPEPLKDIKVLSEKDWLFGARRMPWEPGTRGPGAWKKKGILISKDDDFVPDFKYNLKCSPLSSDLSKFDNWGVVKNINQHFLSKYSNIKHLEDTVLTPKLGIEIRTTMEYLRKAGIDINTYFDLTNEVNLIIYYQMINIPIYSSIPLKERGREK